MTTFPPSEKPQDVVVYFPQLKLAIKGCNINPNVA